MEDVEAEGARAEVLTNAEAARTVVARAAMRGPESALVLSQVLAWLERREASVLHVWRADPAEKWVVSWQGDGEMRGCCGATVRVALRRAMREAP